MQERLMRNQQKLQRAQLRTQIRLQRRGSLVGPLILLALGLVFLLVQMGRMSWTESLRWYGRWWPALLIAVGLILLLEWLSDQRRQNVAGAPPVRVLGGGVVLLLIFLALAGLSSHAVEDGLEWKDRTFGPKFGDLDQMFGDRHDGYSSTSVAFPAQGTLSIRDPHGDVSVVGTSTDGQVHVAVHTQAYAWKNNEADNKIHRLQPAISTQGNNLVLSVGSVDGGVADLTLTVPSTASLTVNAGHGDVTISDLHAAVSLSADNGDVEISQISANVKADVNDDDATLSLHDITGSLVIGGHTGDVEIANVSGAVEMQGDFYGTTDVEHVSGPVRFETSRTRFSAARLDGNFSVENDSLDAREMLGPVVLKTSAKNITLDRVQGDVDVTDSDGSVEVTNALPLGAIDIQNRHGSVDIGLPAGAGFVLKAQTRNGDMENDFGLTSREQNETHSLDGTVRGGGPTVTVTTSDGDVTVRKSTVAPLPPSPAEPPSPPAPPSSRRGSRAI